MLVDEDLTLIAVAGGGGYNPFWLTGELLEIEASDDGSIVRKSVVRDHGGVLPDHACTPARPRKLSLVPA